MRVCSGFMLLVMIMQHNIVYGDHLIVDSLGQVVTYLRRLPGERAKRLIVVDIEDTLLHCGVRSSDIQSAHDFSQAVVAANQYYAQWLNTGSYDFVALESCGTAQAVQSFRSLGDVAFITPRSYACHQKTLEHLRLIGISVQPEDGANLSVIYGPQMGIFDHIAIAPINKIIYTANSSKEVALQQFLASSPSRYDEIVMIDNRVNELEEAVRGAAGVKKIHAILYNPSRTKHDVEIHRHTTDCIDLLAQLVEQKYKEDKKVLVLLDIDHTLLKLKDHDVCDVGGFYGARLMYKKLRDTGMEDIPARKEVLGAYIDRLHQGVEQVPVEGEETVRVVHKIMPLCTILFLTGRPADVDQETQDALRALNLLPVPAHQLFPHGALWMGENIAGAARATSDNIVYTGMSNKGLFARRIFEAAASMFDTIIFMDDEGVHIDDVERTFVEDAATLLGLREFIGITYTRMHHGVSDQAS